MSSKLPFLIVTGFLFLATPGATEEQGVLGQGNVSCLSWLNGRKGGDAQASNRAAWVLGYVTAFNRYGSNPIGDVSGGINTAEIMGWVDNYCGQNPSENLYMASAALVDEFRQKLGR